MANVTRLFSFYVPMHSQNNTHSISKKIEVENEKDESMIGSGELNFIDNENIEESNASEDNVNLPIPESENPKEFNERKRKLLGNDKIFKSFMNPKFVKTSKIVMESNEKKPKIVKTENKTQFVKIDRKGLNHKFKLE